MKGVPIILFFLERPQCAITLRCYKQVNASFQLIAPPSVLNTVLGPNAGGNLYYKSLPCICIHAHLGPTIEYPLGSLPYHPGIWGGRSAGRLSPIYLNGICQLCAFLFRHVRDSEVKGKQHPAPTGSGTSASPGGPSGQRTTGRPRPWEDNGDNVHHRVNPPHPVCAGYGSSTWWCLPWQFYRCGAIRSNRTHTD